VTGPPATGRLIVSVLCASHLLLIYLVSYRFWGLAGCKRIYLLLYPVSVVVVMRILARAWWWLMVRRAVRWRNTFYAIDRRGNIVH